MHRFLLTFLAAGTLVSSADESILPPRDPAYKLVWSDEFDEEGPPDPAKWLPEQGFERNRELQWYQAENARCEEGFLVIEARRERIENPRFEKGSSDWKKHRSHAEYTSASLVTFGENAWSFGRYEIRARFKALPGLWPAIWTTGRGRWPHGGEIDIMEFYKDQLLANFVWAGKGGRDHWASSYHPISKFDRETWDGKFHLWVMEWDEEKISIYVDGKHLNTLSMKTPVNEDGPRINPFLKPHHFRLNMAIGSNGGDPSETPFPQRYEIDYVRIYQK